MAGSGNIVHMETQDSVVAFGEIAAEICAETKAMDVLERVEHLQQEFAALRNAPAKRFVEMCWDMLAQLLELNSSRGRSKHASHQRQAVEKLYVAKRYFWEEIHA